MNNLQGNCFKLLLDDLRSIDDCYPLHPAYLEQNWVVVRNYDDFVEVITKAGLPEFISFDNYLGDIASDVEQDGLFCAKWLVDYCLTNLLPIPDYTIHSQNEAGKLNIRSYMENANKHLNHLKQ